jgi:hypothetical protein
MATTNTPPARSMTTRNRLDDDPFLDDDLLDFEDPTRRELVAAKVRRVRLPGTITAARSLMALQVLTPFVLPFVTRRNGGGGQVPRPTTTTTLGQAATTAARQGGRGGVVLIFLLGVLAFYVGLIVVATKLGRASALARYAAFGVEGLILLASVRGLTGGRGFVVLSAVLGAFAVSVIVLLLTPSANKAFSQTTAVGDISARFDIRSLEDLDA